MTNAEKLYERAIRYIGTRFTVGEAAVPAARKIAGYGNIGPDGEGWGVALRSLLAVESQTGLPANHLEVSAWASYGTEVSPDQVRQGDTIITGDGRIGIVDFKKADRVHVIGLVPRMVTMAWRTIQDGDRFFTLDPLPAPKPAKERPEPLPDVVEPTVAEAEPVIEPAVEPTPERKKPGRKPKAK